MSMKVVGLGTLCLTSQFLKQLGLKEASMPFDWIFSSPEMIAHAIKDDFKQFLDQGNLEPIPLDRRPHPSLHRADNTFYRDNFGVNFIYNHHDPSSKIEDLQYFERCAERFRSIINRKEKVIFLLFKHLHAEPSDLSIYSYRRLADILYPHELLCMEIVTKGGAECAYEVIACEENLEIGRFAATAECTGVSFGSQVDHDAVAAIVRDRVAGAKPTMRPLPVRPVEQTARLSAASSPKHVDQVTLYRGMLTVDGWSKSGPPSVLYSGKPALAWQAYHAPRPDVAHVYGPDSVEWGFTIRALVARPPIDPAQVTLAFPDGTHVVDLDIIRATVLQSVPSQITAPPTAPLFP